MTFPADDHAFGAGPVDPAAAVEQQACPTCGVPAGNACRTAGGETAFRYHTTRLLLVPALGGVPEVLVPQERGPGQPWRAAPVEVIRFGYASCSPIDAEDLDAQLAALHEAQCRLVFLERVGAAVKHRPRLDAALDTAARAKQSHPDRIVALAATELGRIARTSAEFIALAAALDAAGVRLELLGGALAGSFDPGGEGALLFAVLAAAAEVDRAHLRAVRLEAQQAAAAQGRKPGRPKAVDAAMLAEARRLRDAGVPVVEIAERLTISSGKNAGRHPSVASIYRALAADQVDEAAPLADPAPAAEHV